jgi:hypothetical protein
MTISPRGLERELRRRLDAAGRADLDRHALDGVRLTDDGGTVYVHLFMQPAWRHFREGDAYPLAFADHPDLRTLEQWRAFLQEARLLLEDDFTRIVGWLDGR